MSEIEDQIKKDEERLILKKVEKELNIKTAKDVDNITGMIDDYIKSGKGEVKDMDNEFNKRFSEMEKTMKEMKDTNAKLLKEQQKSLYKDRVSKLVDENKDVYPYLNKFNDKEAILEEFLAARDNLKDPTVTDQKILEFLNERFEKVAKSFNLSVVKDEVTGSENEEDEEDEKKEEKSLDERKQAIKAESDKTPEVTEDEIKKYSKDDKLRDEFIPSERDAMKQSLLSIGIEE